MSYSGALVIYWLTGLLYFVKQALYFTLHNTPCLHFVLMKMVYSGYRYIHCAISYCVKIHIKSCLQHVHTVYKHTSA